MLQANLHTASFLEVLAKVAHLGQGCNVEVKPWNQLSFDGQLFLDWNSVADVWLPSSLVRQTHKFAVVYGIFISPYSVKVLL